jgi:putative ABC transport system permease protein
VLKNDGVVVDACDDDKLGYPALNDIREVGGKRARIVAKSHGVTGFMAAPYVFTTYERAERFLHKRADKCSYFLVQVQPGVPVERVCADIQQILPEVEAFPKSLYSRISVNFWMTRTGLGISFGAATLLGLFVGLVMVAETLYALVLDRLSEFATLKAIGAKERQVYQILMLQALIMAAAGAVVGLAVVALVQQLFSTPRAPILVPWWLSLGSCLLVVVICLISSLLPYLRIRKLDPQMVLQS